MPAPAVGAVGALSTVGFANLRSIPVPSGTVAGSVVVAFFYTEDTAGTITLPSGFAHAVGSPISTSNHQTAIAWKRLTGTDTGTYDFGTTNAAWCEGVAIRFAGVVSAGVPFDVTNTGSGSGTPSPATSVTTTQPDTLLVWMGSNFDGGSWTVPSGFTSVAGGGTFDLTIATRNSPSPAATGSLTGTPPSVNFQTVFLGSLLSEPQSFAGIGSFPQLGPMSIGYPWSGPLIWAGGIDAIPPAGTAASGTAALDLTASGTGVGGLTASGSLTLVGNSSTQVVTSATASLTLTGAGAVGAAPTATATLTLTGVLTAQAPVAGTGSISLSASGVASGSPTGSGSLTLTGSGTANGSPTGTGSLTLTASGTAVGVQAATGSGSLSLTASGTASGPFTSSGSITLTGTVLGGQIASGSGSLTLTANNPTFAGTATGSGSISLTASGNASGTVTGSGSLTLTASGTASAAPVGTALLSLTASGTAATLSATSGTGSLTLTGSGTARAQGVATATLTLTATGSSSSAASGSGVLTLNAAQAGSTSTKRFAGSFLGAIVRKRNGTFTTAFVKKRVAGSWI